MEPLTTLKTSFQLTGFMENEEKKNKRCVLQCRGSSGLFVETVKIINSLPKTNVFIQTQSLTVQNSVCQCFISSFHTPHTFKSQSQASISLRDEDIRLSLREMDAQLCDSNVMLMLHERHKLGY